MSFLDMRTVMFMLLVTNCVCTLLILLLWGQNRRRYAGTHLWALDFICQTTGIFLILLRGAIPDWLSVVAGNAFLIAGAILIYAGLNRFFGKKVAQNHNYIVLTAFVILQAYFTYVQPHVAARIFIFSTALLIVCLQIMWLLFFRTETSLRAAAAGVGMAFAGYSFTSIIRMINFFLSPYLGQDYFQSGTFQALIMVSYAVLIVLVTHTLSLLLNRRLLNEIATEEEKFSKAFHSSPNAVTISRLSDGKVLEMNEGFLKISGYSREEMARGTTLGLNFWINTDDREAIVNELLKQGAVKGREYQFRNKSGEIIYGLVSAEVLTLENSPCALSSIVDITAHKRDQLEREDLIRELQKALSEVRTLSGMLPICSSCKKIRDDRGYWSAIETYISKHSQAEFSHSLCPECLRKLYPEFIKEKK